MMTANPGSEADQAWPHTPGTLNDPKRSEWLLPNCPECQTGEVRGQYVDNLTLVAGTEYKIWCECGREVRAPDREAAVQKFTHIETTVTPPKRVFGDGEGSGPLAPGEVPDVRTGDKATEGKDRWCLLPLKALRLVVKVLTHGAVTYSDHGWRTTPNNVEMYRDALQRHFVKRYGDGVKIDPQYGLPHLAHMCACALILLALDEEKS